MGVNALPSAALVMMMGMNMMGSGGCRLFLAGIAITVIRCRDAEANRKCCGALPDRWSGG